MPVNTVKSDIAAGLAAQAGSSYDSIVAINHLSSNTSEVKSFIKQVQRLLKPGGTFVFIQKINTSSSPLSGLVRIGSSGEAVGMSQFCQFRVQKPSSIVHCCSHCSQSSSKIKLQTNAQMQASQTL